jgi:hypothetical protein
MAAGADGYKVPPAQVVTEALDTVAAGGAEAIVGETAQRVKSVLHEDVRALYPQLVG